MVPFCVSFGFEVFQRPTFESTTIQFLCVGVLGLMAAGIFVWFWFWYKTVLYIAMYAGQHLLCPLVERIIEPLWRRVVLPLLKWTVTPGVVIHKLVSTDSVRAFLDKLR